MPLTRRRHHGERTDVDAPVEHHIDMLDSDIWVDNKAFTLFGPRDCQSPSRILLRNQRCNIGLDAASSNANENDGRDESSQAGTVSQCGWDRRADQNQESKHVDSGRSNKSLVLSKVLVCNDAARKRSHITPKLEECRKPSGTCMAESQTALAKVAFTRLLNVVLEDTIAAVISETLTELDYGDQEDDKVGPFANMSKGLLLSLSRHFAFGGFRIFRVRGTKARIIACNACMPTDNLLVHAGVDAAVASSIFRGLFRDGIRPEFAIA